MSAVDADRPIGERRKLLQEQLTAVLDVVLGLLALASLCLLL
jgi:hypothetical protein